MRSNEPVPVWECSLVAALVAKSILPEMNKLPAFGRKPFAKLLKKKTHLGLLPKFGIPLNVDAMKKDGCVCNAKQGKRRITNWLKRF